MRLYEMDARATLRRLPPGAWPYLFEARFGELPAETAARVASCDDAERLRAWLVAVGLAADRARAAAAIHGIGE